MHILMLTSELPPVIGGIATHVYELSKNLCQQGHQVSIVTRRVPDSCAEEQIGHVKIYRFKLPGNRLLYECLLKHRLKNLIQKNQFDILHIHGMRPLNAAYGLSIPICFTNHSSGFLNRMSSINKIQRAYKRIRHCDMILAPSRELIAATKKTGYKGSVEYIPNGVDTKVFSPASSHLRSHYGIADDTFVVLLARRLAKKNGVLFFAEAINQVKNEHCVFVVAGDGEDRAQFEKIVKQKIMSGQVKMLGYIDNTMMPDIYRMTDVSVLPSLQEATSIAGLESLSTGKPIISTRVGGIPEIIQDNINGFLVQSKNTSALAEKIDFLIENPDKLKHMKNQARQNVLTTFSWQTVTEKTISMYRQLLIN